jgi:hypothetical protein
MSEETQTLVQTMPAPHRKWYRVALVATVALILLVVGLLPVAVRSMQEILGRTSDPLYDMLTRKVVTPDVADQSAIDATYVNIGIVDLDEAKGLATLAVSGNRNCSADCPSLNLTLTALDNDADQRRGLPPSSTLSLSPTDRIFSQSVQLPLRGQPSLYPFDQYQLWLGLGGQAISPDGKTVEIDPQLLQERHAIVTLQNRVPDMIMPSPTNIDPASVRTASDPFHFLAVQAVTLNRPAYLKVLALALVLLITVSAALALLTRGIDELALGFGGLVLGVWGVRSILMPQSIGTVTAIDLALSWLILLLLLGLAIRAALHFLHHSELQVSKPGRKS